MNIYIKEYHSYEKFFESALQFTALTNVQGTAHMQKVKNSSNLSDASHQLLSRHFCLAGNSRTQLASHWHYSHLNCLLLTFTPYSLTRQASKQTSNSLPAAKLTREAPTTIATYSSKTRGGGPPAKLSPYLTNQLRLAQCHGLYTSSQTEILPAWTTLCPAICFAE